MSSKRFYGWPLVGVGFLIYGLGIAPAYYSWGFFAPEVIAELGISRQQVGTVFGALTVTFALSSFLSAAVIHYFGLRVTVTVGALICALSWFFVGRAESLTQIYLCFSLLGGIGIGLSTQLPAQTLAVYWFDAYRARATAVILLGAAVVGALVTPVDAMILEHADWRTAWVYISATSLLVAIIAIVFIRNRPEDISQHMDGRLLPMDQGSSAAVIGRENTKKSKKSFTLIQAIATPQFVIAAFADIANTIPWRVLTVHGRLHLEDLGFAPTLAAAVLGVRVGMSGVGRLSGALCDFIAPQRVMALALVVSALGIAGLRIADTPTLAYACVVLLGLGYGAAFTSAPVVFASFFGREAFAATSGLRIAITGVVGFIGPSWAGAVADSTGSYNSTLFAMTILCMVGAVMIFRCRAPEGLRGN
jgi:MFS transporter, OFA family, oxalate/formate antiporter